MKEIPKNICTEIFLSFYFTGPKAQVDGPQVDLSFIPSFLLGLLQ